ncbi:replication factor A protein 2 [Mortierella sp. GBA35]|nr:replication factor A protein 2 [Mortierella sp. AD031]KAF9107613.1 replication factor A protein 2 [Mortierella sp. GBA35]KAG0219141.1 replication factor A protein 2 [Mortierella sp. NVP41]
MGVDYNRGGYGSSQGQGFVQDSFGNEGAPAKRSYSNHTLRPVTIKQILEASQTQADGDFKIDGHEIGQITLIAAARVVNRQATQHSYTVEDGTGSIECRRFPSEYEDAEELNAIIVGAYVRVTGTVKSFNNKHYVQVFSIRPVLNADEITYHNLEILYVHVSSTRPKTGAHGGGFAGHQNNNQNNYNNNMQGVSSTDTHMGGGGDDLDGTAQNIVDFIKENPRKDTGMGAHRRDIIDQFARRLGGAEAVNRLITTMTEDGHLYAGEDDDHLIAV